MITANATKNFIFNKAHYVGKVMVVIKKIEVELQMYVVLVVVWTQS